MLMFFRIDRPITQTLRPVSTATSTACCIRCTFDAKLATSTRPYRTRMILRHASPPDRSAAARAPRPRGRRRLGGAPRENVHPLFPLPREPAHVGPESVDRRVVELV